MAQANEVVLADGTVVNLDELQPITDVITSTRRWDVRHNELKGETIVILGFVPITTQYGEALLADIVHDGETKTCLMGAEVLIKQLEEAKEHFPVVAVVGKQGRYYSFVAPERVAAVDNDDGSAETDDDETPS